VPLPGSATLSPERGRSSRTPRALVADPDRGLRLLLLRLFKAEKYTTLAAADESALLATLAASTVDIVVLSCELARGNVSRLRRQIRRRSAAPVLWLLPPNAADPVASFLSGEADDFLTVPFTDAELRVRIRRALRRAREAHGKISRRVFDGVEIDLSRGVVRRDGSSVQLSRKQFDVLRLLTEADGAVLPYHEFLHSIWGTAGPKQVGSLRRTINGLRRKLEPDPRNPSFIVTANRVGYRLRTRPAQLIQQLAGASEPTTHP
jgi:two-component system, OmpR family, KDP operon response regulator KdpE